MRNEKVKKDTKLRMEIDEEDARVLLKCIEDIAWDGVLSEALQDFGIKLRTKFFPKMERCWWELSEEEIRKKHEKGMKKLYEEIKWNE